ncbi:MAG: alpha/beta hydrolase [Deltaproteobacteria bacterium]|nr:alpha/beta hydrolase [Deltaproteobacteria bacterium]
MAEDEGRHVCYSHPSRIAATKKGPIEYAMQGDGPAVLVIHGCPGGYDQGLIAARLTRDPAFKFIAPSRPGYLRTPLTVGATPEAQADAYAALLDALEIRRAAIIGISGGGPSALHFAARHPDRCWGVVTVSAIGKQLSASEIDNCQSLRRRTLFTLGLFSSLLWNGALAAARQCLERLLSNVKKVATVWSFRPEERVEFFLGLLRNCTMISMRKAGLRNDVTQLTDMPGIPLNEIKTPTLILHGTADDVVPYAHAEFIARGVAHSELAPVRGGRHLFFATHREQVLPAVMEFLRRNAPMTSPG